MPSSLAYGSNTIIVRSKAKKKETLRDNIERGNNRFTNKAIDKYGNQIINQAGNQIIYPETEPKVGDRVVYPAGNITTAEVIENEQKQQGIMHESSLKISKLISKTVDRNRVIMAKYASDNPDVNIEFLSRREREKNLKGGIRELARENHERKSKLRTDQGPRHTHTDEMTDQGPPRKTSITEMREDVPHREGLKTTGLSAQEIADLELSEEEMAAVGGEDLPMTEEEKGALKTSGLTKKVTTANINKDFERLIDDARDLSYDKKLEKYEFIKDKLESKYDKLLVKYKDYIVDGKFIRDTPENVYNELKTTYDNKEKIKNVITRHKVLSPKKENIIV
jgi:hypothetical protein